MSKRKALEEIGIKADWFRAGMNPRMPTISGLREEAWYRAESIPGTLVTCQVFRRRDSCNWRILLNICIGEEFDKTATRVNGPFLDPGELVYY